MDKHLTLLKRRLNVVINYKERRDNHFIKNNKEALIYDLCSTRFRSTQCLDIVITILRTLQPFLFVIVVSELLIDGYDFPLALNDL